MIGNPWPRSLSVSHTQSLIPKHAARLKPGAAVSSAVERRSYALRRSAWGAVNIRSLQGACRLDGATDSAVLYGTLRETMGINRPYKRHIVLSLYTEIDDRLGRDPPLCGGPRADGRPLPVHSVANLAVYNKPSIKII